MSIHIDIHAYGNDKIVTRHGTDLTITEQDVSCFSCLSFSSQHVPQVRDNGTSPAFTAAEKGHDEVVRVLWELKADLNQVGTSVCAMNAGVHEYSIHTHKRGSDRCGEVLVREREREWNGTHVDASSSCVCMDMTRCLVYQCLS